MSRTMFSLTGKSAVITGAGSGIGEAVARRFREAGAEVLLVDRRDASMLADSLGGAFFQADVSVVSELEAAMRASKERFGKLDILVSNAGIQPLGVGFADLTEALFDRTMAVNVRSVAFGIRLAGKLLSDGGRVLNATARGATLAEARDHAYAALGRIDWPGGFYRSDIGWRAL